MLSPAQLRAARALLNIDRQTLADQAGVPLAAIERMEAGEGHARGAADSLRRVIVALERAGLEMIGDNAVSSGGGRGVRLRETDPAGWTFTSPDPEHA